MLVKSEETQDPEQSLNPIESTQEGITIEESHDHPLETRRGLSPRHLQLMTIAGGIGVVLFVGIGGVLSKGGPINLILGYLFYGCPRWSPGYPSGARSMSWLPIRGSIYELASRFVDPALGFAMGWTYFFASAMVVCTEYSAFASIIQYWNTSVNPAAWVTITIATCCTINLVAVRWYGESEFIVSSTKVLLLLGLMLITLITMLGGNPHHDMYGFRNWTDGQAMHSYHSPGTTGRFLGFFIAIRYGGFTVGGPDFISLSAGEIQNPRRTIPRVSKMIFYRIIFFYVAGVTCVGILCPSRHPLLVSVFIDKEGSSSTAAASPWVIGMLNVGIGGFLPGFINFLILLSGWSCGNAFLYSASRTLYSLAKDGHAPALLLRCTKAGAPYVAVLAVTAITLLTFLVSSNDAIVVFEWFLELTTVSLVVKFTAMSWVFIGWYRALKTQGIARVTKHNSDQATRGIVFPYIAPFAKYTMYLTLVVGSAISLFIGFDVLEPWDAKGFVTSYFGLAWFWGMFLFWKVVKKTRFVVPGEVDIFADGLKQKIDAECEQWERGDWDLRERERLKEMNFFMRGWRRFWGR